MRLFPSPKGAGARRLAAAIFLFLSVLLVGCREEPSSPTLNPSLQSRAIAPKIYSAEVPFHELAAETPGFGGYYLNQDGQLVVLLVDTTKRSEVTTRIMAHSTDGRLPPDLTSKGVRVHAAQFDFPSLAHWRDLVTEAFLGVVDGVNETDADEVINRVRIGIDLKRHPEAEAEVLARLPALGVPLEAVRIE